MTNSGEGSVDSEGEAGSVHSDGGEAIGHDGQSDVVTDWGRGPEVEVPDQPIHRLIERRAEEEPERIAVRFGGEAWTYGELNRRATSLARELCSRGVRAGTRVGINVERSPEMIQALLGVLKSGGTYVPLEPSTPDERSRYMAADAGAEYVVVGDGGDREWGGCAIVDVRDHREADGEALALDLEVDPEQPAYVLYTSGTTGKPKGILMPHRAVVNHCAWRQSEFGLGEGDSHLFKSPLGFDASVLEIYPVLCAGGTVVGTQPEGEKDPAHMAEVIERHEVNRLFTVPIQLNGLLYEETFRECDHLTHVFCGGEVWSPAMRERFLDMHPDTELFNPYGPTEACIYTTTWRCRAEPEYPFNPIGKPVGNYRLRVMGTDLDPVARGAEGELFVGGPGLGYGYQGMPGKTALTFVPEAGGEEPGSRMYRTGDIVCWDERGNLEYVARRDDQIQIQGVRTELPAVESVLEEVDGIDVAAVRPVDIGGAGEVQALAAYVVGRAPSLEALEAHAEAHLEDAQVPKFWQVLDEMPLNNSGKVDRDQLPDPEGLGDRNELGEPATEVESRVAAIWRAHLDLERVGVDENFFELGGHSLVAVRMQSALAEEFGAEIPLDALLEAPTIRGWAEQIDSEDETAQAEPVEDYDYAGEAPMSSEQERLWFLQRMHPGDTSYNEPLVFRLLGDVDETAFEEALVQVVERHEILRTTFVDGDRGPTQTIAEEADESRWRLRDLRDDDAPEQMARELIDEALEEPFELSEEPPFRAGLYRLAEEEYVVGFVFHHIAIDEWSTRLFIDELEETYTAASEGREATLEPPKRQVADYAIWQREQLDGHRYERGLDFWRNHLEGAREGIDWPIGGEPIEDHRPVGYAPLELDGETSARLQEWADRRGESLFVTLYAAFSSFLAAYTRQRDLTVGVPATMRTRPELQGTLGFLLNTVPMRVQGAADEGFADWFETLASGWREASEHQWIPLDKIVEAVGGGQTGGRATLFDVIFTYVPGDASGEEFVYIPGDSRSGPFGPLESAPFDYGGLSEAKTALSVGFWKQGNHFAGSFEYDRGRFDGEDVDRMTAAFEQFLATCLEDRERSVMRQSVAVEPSEETLTREWAQGPRTEVVDVPVHRLFERRVEDHPSAVALEWDDGHWSYETLNRKANRVAHLLRQRGVGPETPVGLHADRSPELVATVLGLLKAGGAFIPLEAGLPAERLSYMATDADAELVVTLGTPDPVVAEEDWEVLAVDEVLEEKGEPGNPETAIDPDHLSYLMYTSGTTGRPKGVMTRHGAFTSATLNLVEIIYGSRDLEGPRPDKTLLLKSTYTFELFLAEAFTPLVRGGDVVVGPPGVEQDVGRLVELIERHGVTDLWGTPTQLQVFLESGALSGGGPLETVYSVGEALTDEFRRRLETRWGVSVWNCYGPTEMCMGQANWRVDSVDGNADREGVVSVGRAVTNHWVSMVDELARPVPQGVDGEIVITGEGEARGYLGMPRRTAESFVPAAHGEAPGERMYATGDLGRWRPDGRIDYRGRIDDQLQVRGVRVELGEVEAHLDEAPGVGQAAVLPVDEREGRAESLVGYVVPESEGAFEVSEVRDYLSGHLKEAVVPGRYIELEEMPRTPAGKVDREELPEPERQSRDGERVPPRTNLEETIASIWRMHLELDEIGVFENFFEIGGHSLLAMRIASELSTELGIEVPLERLFETPTIAGMAESIAEAEERDREPIARRDDRESAPLSADQRGWWFQYRRQPESMRNLTAEAVTLRGELRRECFERALVGLVGRHDILRTIFREEDGEPVQRIRPEPDRVTYLYEDLRGESAPEEVARERLRDQVRGAVFDLAVEPPLRITLLRTGDDEHTVLFLFHHIAMDFESMTTLFGEFQELYAAELEERSPQLEELPIQYADYAVWQLEQLEGERFEESIDYWVEQLDGAEEGVEWPFAQPSEEIEYPTDGGRYEWVWPAERREQLREMARRAQTSRFVILCALWTAFVGRLTGSSEITVGVPVSRRKRAELENVIGILINTIPLHLTWSPSFDFGEWLTYVDRQWRRTVPHQWVPQGEIAKAVSGRRGGDEVAFADTLTNYLDVGTWSGSFGELSAERLDLGLSHEVNCALGAGFLDREGQLSGVMEYDARRLDTSSVERIADQFDRFVQACLETSERSMGDHRLVGEADRRPPSGAWSAETSVDESEMDRREEASFDASDDTTETETDEPEASSEGLSRREKIEQLTPEQRERLRAKMKQTTSDSDASASSSVQRTVTRLQNGKNRPPLIVPHSARGTVVGYRSIVDRIDEGVPVWGLRSPGLEQPEELPATMEALVDRYAADVRQMLDGEACRIAGWSFGGVVAFELARQLREADVTVEHLTLLDAPPPARELPPEEREQDTGFEAFAFNLGKTFDISDEQLTRLRTDFEEVDQSDRYAWLADRVREWSGDAAVADPTLLERLFRISMTHRDAYLDYEPGPIAVPATYVAATAQSAELAGERIRGWRTPFEGRLRVVEYNVGHHELLTPEMAPRLAELLAGRARSSECVGGREIADDTSSQG